MGPKKRAAENVDNGGGGTSQKKKKGEKEAEKANPADKAENTGKAKLAAKAPAEKIVIPKSELKTPSPPPSGRLFKVGARACATAPPPIRTPASCQASHPHACCCCCCLLAAKLPCGCCEAPTRADVWAQIISWNVTTLRSLVNKNPSLLARLFTQERPDVVFLQETKLNEAEHAEYEGKIAEVTIGTRRPGGILR